MAALFPIFFGVLMAVVYKQADHVHPSKRYSYTLDIVLRAFFRYLKVTTALAMVLMISFWFSYTVKNGFAPAHYIVCLVVMDWAWLSYKTRRFC